MKGIDTTLEAARFDSGLSNPTVLESESVQSLFLAVTDAVAIYDLRSGRVLEWNPAAEHLFGYSREEALQLQFMEMLPERVREGIQALLSEYLSGDERREGHLYDVPRELPALHKSGRELTVELSATLIGGPGSVHALTIIRDCTERKRLDRERAELLARAREHARSVSELATLQEDFTAMVAHELVTPVSSIRGLAALLDRDGVSETQRGDLLGMIQSEAKLLQRLVDDFRAAARLERDHFAIEPEPVPVADLLAEAEAVTRAMLAVHDFRVDPAPPVVVLADRERIGQVLRNLLGNAAKYTPPGTLVELRARRDEGCGTVRVEVSNQGPVIDPDDLERIFTKFGRGRDVEGGQQTGVGFGLYLSRRIALAHGGDITVESELATGTTFRFTLQETDR